MRPMRTWFGELEDNKIVLAGNSVDALSKWVESSDSKSLDKSIDLAALSEKSGFCSSSSVYRRILHETAMRVAGDLVTAGLTSKDTQILQAVKALDDVNEAYNVITERLFDWCSTRFPVQSMKPAELIDRILKSGSNEELSVVAVMSDEDTAVVKGLAATAKALYDERKVLEGYITSGMEELAPNLSKVLGPLLGARLTARAGGIDKLAKMPASTIQVMGAGDALFKHLRAGTPSPKHGLIYKHPLILGSPKAARGKISRMLAGKAAIAVRVDYYSGNVVDLGDLKEKAVEIKRRTGGRKKT
jgi:nucleolar protein 56